MTKWITIAKHEYTYNIRRKEFLFVTFGLPLFIFAIVGLPVLLIGNSIIQEEYRIGYVDNTGSFGGSNFTLYSNEDLAKKDLLEGNITQFFVVPSNYFNTGEIYIYSAKSLPSGSKIIEDKIRGFLLDNLLAGEKKETLDRVKNPMNSQYFTLSDKGETRKEDLSAILVPIAFALFFIMSIFTSSNFLLQGVVEEKENRIMEILLSSVSYRDMLVGKIFGLGAVGLTQMFIWQIAGAALLSMNPAASSLIDKIHISAPLLMFGASYFILGYILFACIMAGVGAIATTSREGQQMAGIFSLTAALPLILFQFIAMNPDATITRALSYFPLTSPVTMIMRLSLTDVPFYDVMISTMILALTVLIVIESSVKIFRASLLMYGKKPTISELIKYLRTG
ncbi:MAG: ABC transporter permease [Candidatus Methanoperedens sp.]|nr:ABC transporter permease [Candidatus Methanoperedens sp.]MCZ7369741.1 ABC transporter permease [Candidatus Methanoperedens sp.]